MNILEKFKTITTFVFDVDGVLTDGNLLILNDGQMARQMNIKDGYALQLAIKKGYRVGVISGGNSLAVLDRLIRLGVQDVYLEVGDKKQKLAWYMEQHGLHADEILFMGDDIPDYTIMQFVGLPCCPADSAAEIIQLAAYISPFQGGQGCVRDVIEKVLKLNGHWDLDASVTAR